MDKFVKCVIEASGRHVHLSRQDAEALFGAGYELTPVHTLGESDQFLSTDKVRVASPNGKEIATSVLGPYRKETQIELSYTEARTIGIRPPLGDSGKLDGTMGIRLVANDKVLDLPRGVMVARRHVHMPAADAELLGVKDREMVVLKIDGDRGMIFENVLVRVAPPEMGNTYSDVHLDYDEWNAAGLNGSSATGRLYKNLADILAD